MTVSAYARHRGCDEKAVRRAIEAKRITPIFDKEGRQWIDATVADIQWTKNTRPRVGQKRVDLDSAGAPSGDRPAPGPSSPPGDNSIDDTTYDNAKRRLAVAEARKAEVEAERAHGNALDRKSAEDAAFDGFRELRDTIFAACKACANKVLGLTEVREIELLLEQEVARQPFADWEARMQARIEKAAQA